MKNFKVKEQTESTSSNALFTGWALFNPLVINPTLAELTKLGINRKEEPVYIRKNTNDIEVHQITVYGKVNDSIVNFSIFLEKDIKKSNKNGVEKSMYISNNSMNTKYWDSEETAEAWLKSLDKNDNPNSNWWGTSVRLSFSGESLLYDFLRKFINPDIEQTDDFKLENSPFTPAGIKELNSIVSHADYQNNSIKVLLGVKDDKYQTIITSREHVGLFSYSNPAKNQKIVKGLTESADYKNIVYTLGDLEPYKKPEPTNPFNAIQTAIPSPVAPTAKKDEILPF